MLKELISQKLYYGFPIFLLAYPDDRHGYNVTTCSSSYSLRNMLVFGLGKGTNAAKQLMKRGVGSANVVAPKYHELVEYAGDHHGQDKLGGGRVPYDILDDSHVPILKQASVVLVFHVEHYEVVGGYVNFTATIDKRFAQESLLEDPNQIGRQLDTLHYFGIDHDLVKRAIEAE